MNEPTEAQMNAAHAAYESVLHQWRLRRVSNYGLADDLWALENIGISLGSNPDDAIAAHKFEGAEAEKQAKFMLRDKALKAAVKAALAA